MDTERPPFDARVSRLYLSPAAGMNAMGKETFKKAAKVAQKAAAKRVAAKAAKARKTAAKSSDRKRTTPGP